MSESTKLTEQQARETVARFRSPQHVKDALMRQWLSGDPGARFAVYGAWRRLNADAL